MVAFLYHSTPPGENSIGETIDPLSMSLDPVELVLNCREGVTNNLLYGHQAFEYFSVLLFDDSKFVHVHLIGRGARNLLKIEGVKITFTFKSSYPYNSSYGVEDERRRPCLTMIYHISTGR